MHLAQSTDIGSSQMNMSESFLPLSYGCYKKWQFDQ